jgi:type I restriction enzyme M protein
MIAGDEAADGRLVVTTSCTHFEVIPGKAALLADLVFGLSSEAFRVQMRALTTGSDGLSSISTDDIATIILPKIKSKDIRDKSVERIAESQAGHLVLGRGVRDELAKTTPAANVPPRSSHVVQV